MKKRAVIFGLICNTIIIFVLLNSCEVFLGNRTELERDVATRLKEKYGKEFVITDMVYQFGSNSYYGEAHPKGKPEEKVKIEGMYDNYSVVRIISPEFAALRKMPVIFSYSIGPQPSQFLDKYTDQKNYKEISVFISIAVLEKGAAQEVLETVKTIQKELDYLKYIEYQIAIKKKRNVEIETDDYDELMKEHKDSFKVYCSDGIDGEIQKKPRCSEMN